MFSGLYRGNCQYDYLWETEKKQKKERKLNDKIFFRPNLGLSFGNQYAYAEISTLVGYKITPRFWAGAGPKYLFIKEGEFKRHIYGPKFFAQFAVLDKINETINIGLGSVIIYGEYELLSLEMLLIDNTTYNISKGPRQAYHIAAAGFGLRFPFGERSGMSIMALWGLTDSARLLYNNPEIRFSFDI